MAKTYRALAAALPGKVFYEGAPEYTELISSYFSQQQNDTRPLCVVRPQTTDDVAKAIQVLTDGIVNHQDTVQFAIRSGGHAAFAGASNAAGGATLDLRALDGIEVSEDQNLVTVGTGRRGVGVGGLTLGGGLSHFSGRAGLVCDNVVEYEIVLSSGQVTRIRENDSKYGDLFRALRGGANNFGIVTRFTFKTIRQQKIWGGMLIHGLESKDHQLQAFHDYAAGNGYDPYASLMTSAGFSTERGKAFANALVYTKPEATPASLLPFTKIEPIYMNTLKEQTLAERAVEQDAFNTSGLCQMAIATTFYLDPSLLHKSFDLWESSCDAVKNMASMVWAITFQVIPPAVSVKSQFLREAVPTLSMEDPKPIVILELTGTWAESQHNATVENLARKLIADIEAAAKEKHMQTGYNYLNYAWAGQQVYNGPWKQRLQEVSKKYDPHQVFQKNVLGGFKLF